MTFSILSARFSLLIKFFSEPWKLSLFNTWIDCPSSSQTASCEFKLFVQVFAVFDCSTGMPFLLPDINWQSPFYGADCSSPERKSRGTACIIKYNVSFTQYLINNQLDLAPHRHNIIPHIWISLHLSSRVDNALNTSLFQDFLCKKHPLARKCVISRGRDCFYSFDDRLSCQLQHRIDFTLTYSIYLWETSVGESATGSYWSLDD